MLQPGESESNEVCFPDDVRFFLDEMGTMWAGPFRDIIDGVEWGTFDGWKSSSVPTFILRAKSVDASWEEINDDRAAAIMSAYLRDFRSRHRGVK